jgi:hypothetical protein
VEDAGRFAGFIEGESLEEMKMKGFVFSIDSLFALVVCSAILLSINSITSGFGVRHVPYTPGSDVLLCLEEQGKLFTVETEELDAMLSPFNRCGTLTVDGGGAGGRTVSTCECGDEVEVSVRSFVSEETGQPVFRIAKLKTCAKVSP